jgi:hypothetical protein
LGISNNAIFDELKLAKHAFVKEILGYPTVGIFPECKTLEDLEKLVKALKKDKNIKNPWAVAWSKYNKGELKENTKITIGDLRKLIKEELLKIK